MILAADSTASTGLDPTMQVLLTIFGAALVTAAAGFVGAWLQSHREHARWIRERRLDAYLDLLLATRELVNAGESRDQLKAEVNEAHQRWELLRRQLRDATDDPERLAALQAESKRMDREAGRRDRELRELAKMLSKSSRMAIERLNAASLLGPQRVIAASNAAQRSMKEGPEVARSRIFDLEVAMRDALKIDI